MTLSSGNIFSIISLWEKFSSLKGESEIELMQDFMTVFATCKFDEDPIKNEVAILRTTFSLLQVYGSYIKALKGK